MGDDRVAKNMFPLLKKKGEKDIKKSQHLSVSESHLSVVTHIGNLCTQKSSVFSCLVYTSVPHVWLDNGFIASKRKMPSGQIAYDDKNILPIFVIPDNNLCINFFDS